MFRREYHEEKPGFVSKVLGAAVLGATVIYGLKKHGPSILSAIDNMESSTIGQRLLSKLERNVQGRYTVYADEAFQQFGSAESKLFLEGADKYRSLAATTLTADNRITNFINEISKSGFIENPTHLLEVGDSVRGLLSRVGRSQSATDVGEGFLSKQGLTEFNAQLSKLGVKHNFGGHNQQLTYFTDVINRLDQIPSGRDLTTYLERNQDQFLSLLHEARTSMERNLVNQRAKHTPNVRQLLWRDLADVSPDGNITLKNSKHAKQAKAWLKDTYALDDDLANQWLQNKITDTQRALKQAFGVKADELPGRQYQAAFQMFLDTHTGIDLNTKTGKALSRNRSKEILTRAFERAGNELQLPLVPYKFNVPLKSLNIMPKSKVLTQDLGSLRDNPELQRLLSKGSVADPARSQVLLLGKKAMVLNPKSTQVLPGTFSFYKASDSKSIERLMEVRTQASSNFFKNTLTFKGSPYNRTKLQRKLIGQMDHVGELEYHKTSAGNGFKIKGRNSFNQSVVDYVYGNDFIDPREIHPNMLMDFLKKHNNSLLDPNDLYRTLNKVVQEGAQQAKTINPYLKSYARNIGLRGWFSGDIGTPNEVLHYLLSNTDNPAEAVEHLMRELPRSKGKNILELTSDLESKVAHRLYQSLNALKNNTNALHGTTRGEGNLIHSLRNVSLGQDNISSPMSRLEEGLLSQILQTEAIGKYGGHEEIDKLMQNVVDQLADGTSYESLISQHQLLQDFATVGLDTSAHFEQIFKHLNTVRDSDKPFMAHYGKLGSVLTGLLSDAEINNMSPDRLVKSKLTGAFAHDLQNNPFLTLDQKNYKLRSLIETVDLDKTLKERFHVNRPFVPENLGVDPLGRGQGLLIHDTDYGDVLKNPIGTLHKIKEGLRGSANATINPETSHTKLSAILHMITNAPQHIAEEIGLGLPDQDLTTPLRTSLNWAIKRVLPLYAGVEFYKNFNQNAHERDLPGIDGVAANTLANFNLFSAKIKDSIGFTELTQNLVRAIPGLDQYLTPRSHSEYQEYLMYGDEEVRSGRGWLTGARGAITGGRVVYSRPNFFRRWQSHWTEVAGVADAEHSWLPSLTHPLAPLNRLLDPNWFEHEHRYDRPYSGAGWSNNPEFQQKGTYLGINTEPVGDTYARGSFGANLPTSMSGGGNPYTLTGGDSGGGTGGNSWGGPGGGELPFGRINITLNKDRPWTLAELSPFNMIAERAQALKAQAGLFGAVMKKLPLWPDVGTPFKRQKRSAATSSNQILFGLQWGEGLGTAGEFFRRLIQSDYTSATDINDRPNNQPSFIPKYLRQGDPYMRLPGGIFNLPGEVYERVNPWVAPLKVRGSAVGLSESEIIQKWLNPMDQTSADDGEDILAFGSRVHLLAQREAQKSGILVGAEVSIYDDVHNISGTMDAVLKGRTGDEVVDFKTQGGKHWGTTPEHYIDQITSYMAMTGMQRGHLVFINRDNPAQMRTESFDFDPDRWNRILAKIEHARSVVQTMVAQGTISPFETYDILARIDILSKIAPDSAEFTDMIKYAESSGGFSGFEKQVYKRALKRAESLRNPYRLYPNRFTPTETHRLMVQGIGNNGQIITTKGTFKLAGIEFDDQAFGLEDPEEVLAKYGIRVGRTAPITLLQGQFNPDLMNDATLPAIVGNVNSKLGKTLYADYKQTIDNPLDAKVLLNVNPFRGILERVLHSDNMFSNTFLRVRTATQQLERGEIYGTDEFSWGDMTNTLVKPTVAAVANKHPVVAAAKSYVIASLFVKSKEAKTAVGIVAALAGATVSTAKNTYEIISGKPWKRKAVRKRQEFDDYWDAIKYVKYATLAERAKLKARQTEGVDLDALEQGVDRTNANLGPWATMAVWAENRAKNTMFGYDAADGSLTNALRVIPQRHRQLAESVIMTGSEKEKQRFYDLISESEQRVLARFLGIDQASAPANNHVVDFFSQHYLPGADWAGWSPGVSLEDIETRAAEAEDMRIDRPNRTKIARAELYTKGVTLPNMSARAPHRIMSTLNKLMAHGNFTGINVKHVISPSHSNVINIDTQLLQDQTAELINQR